MRRRTKAANTVKAQRRKALKRSKAPKAALCHSSLAAGKGTNVEQLTRERDEAREQQTATAEILRVIRTSPTDTQPVFEAIVQSGLKLFPDAAILIALPDGNELRAAAFAEPNPARVKALLSRWPIPLTREYNHAIAILDRRIIDIPDAREAPPELATGAQYFLTTGYRAITIMPMMRGGDAIGALSVVRSAPGALSDKQLAVLSTFADQAVIAIENTRLLNELRESLQQQTATADVLKVISSSPGDLKPVFEALLANAMRICEAKFGHLLLYDGESFHAAYLHDVPPSYRKIWERGPMRPGPNVALGRLARTKQVVHIPDIKADPAYAERDPLRVATVELAEARTLLAVPMLKESQLVGAIVLYRQEVRPFNDKQIELVQNFAAQAIIAIENARLLSELRQRTNDLSEALEQQTATSEVLSIISSSPGELKPVFEAILVNATQICASNFGAMHIREGDAFRTVALHGASPPFTEVRMRQGLFKPSASTGLARAVATRDVVHIADIRAEQRDKADPLRKGALESGVRTVLDVPMLKDGEPIGVVAIYRSEVSPFTDKQIELVKNFAAQAVIAIENTRLLNELRESLQQQTATADVLKVISRSTFDLQTVLGTLVESVKQLCDAESAHVFRRTDDTYRIAACGGYSPEYEEYARGLVFTPGRDSLVGRIALEKRLVHIDDVLADPAYRQERAQQLGGWRTMLGVPLSREGVLIGAMTVTRSQVRPFTDKQIDLLTTFADQAVIAIENTRLLSELRESLQQQTATADVLKVISRSAFDLRTVLQTLVESAARLCEAEKGTITRKQGESFYRSESYGFSSEFMNYIRNIPVKPERGTAAGRALLERKAVHIPDVQTDPEYDFEGRRFDAYRTILGVPMLREGDPIGVLTLTRSEVRPFTEKQIELVATFADQAAIAIENVRLFESVEARTRELAASLEDLRATQDRLVQTQKLASLGQLTAGIAHEIKNPLNFVNNFSGVSVELIDELQGTLKDIPFDNKARAAITELTDTLRGNLDKIVQHGQRADSIVKSMLLHSRQGSGERRPVDVNALIEESFNLAYHGARADKRNFNVMVERSLDPAVGKADLFPQEITRVLLNLISNGVYATAKKAQANDESYKPTLIASTKSLGDRIEIKIRDNGTGIEPDIKDKMFNPFFTTKPAGEGTGLGLSISHDIVVKQHAGSIAVDSQPGEFTEIIIILPRTAAFIA
ncbi:MAG: GAF domain-containing protein [Pseudolabrys sp.]